MFLTISSKPYTAKQALIGPNRAKQEQINVSIIKNLLFTIAVFLSMWCKISVLLYRVIGN